VISADVTLNVPDFRAAERCYQLVTQAAGRAGRGETKGSVYVQTYNPDAYALKYACTDDYEGFYKTEIMLREYMHYPPFSDIVQVSFLSASERTSINYAEMVKKELVRVLGRDEEKFILGPRPEQLYVTQGQIKYCITVKVLPQMRKKYEVVLADLKRKINTDRKANCRIIIDVNPF
jgi:primosomal protein N' (replication factor Y)